MTIFLPFILISFLTLFWHSFPIQTHCSKSSFLVHKFNFDFPRKSFFGWKTRENVVVLDFLAVDNFHFTRKIVKIEFLDKKLTFIIVCRVSHLFRMFLGVKKSVECFLRICSIWQSRWVKKNSLACSKNADKKGLRHALPVVGKIPWHAWWWV